MTPLDTVPLRLAGRTSVLTLIGRGLAALARRGARAGILTAAAVRLALRFLLQVAGYGLMSCAAWLVFGAGWGLAAAGLSCLLLEWAVKGGGGRR